ncbi:hypothetical protein LCGC14_1626590 [marine sediment metagenome]|uniref:Uncharacterized protein n=1 Tax=marine sediment metagenome TaxID=412755 RepID=A0A0F9KJG8_9ZZZZ
MADGWYTYPKEAMVDFDLVDSERVFIVSGEGIDESKARETLPWDMVERLSQCWQGDWTFTYRCPKCAYLEYLGEFFRDDPYKEPDHTYHGACRGCDKRIRKANKKRRKEVAAARSRAQAADRKRLEINMRFF